MTLQDRQYQWTAADGTTILMGYGTSIRVAQVQGLLSQSAIKENDLESVADDGATAAGEDRYKERRITFALALDYATQAAVEAALDTFHAAFQRGADGTLTFKRPGKVQRFVIGRVRRADFDADWMVTRGLASGGLQIECRDPRVYSDDLTPIGAQVLTEAGGRTYPRIYPLVYGSTIQGGSMFFTNAGNMEMKPIVRFYGPSTNPYVVSVTQGKTLAMNIVLAAGDVLEVDTQLHTIVLNGTTTRRNAFAPSNQWWTLQKGLNELRYGASIGAGSHVEIDARSAWATG